MLTVDEATGRMMAASEWQFAFDPKATAAKPPTDPHVQPPANWPEGGNWKLRRFFKLAWEEWKRDTLGGKPYIGLSIASPSSLGPEPTDRFLQSSISW